MPITTHRNPSRNLTTFKCDGGLSFNEIVAVIERFFRGSVAPPTNKIIWDMQNVSVATLTADHIYHIANLVSGYTAKDKNTNIAVVISKDIDFEIAKKFREKATDALKIIKVFRKIEEAIEWLEN
jgi:hypothetical protein